MLTAPGIVSASTTTVTGTYKDLNDFGFIVDPMTGIFDGPEASIPTAEMPGRLDVVVLNDRPTGSTRELTVKGIVTAATPSALTTAVRNLTAYARRAVAVKTIRDANTYLPVVRCRVSEEPFATQARVPATRITLTWQAANPFWFATSETSLSFAAGATQMPLGTARSYPIIRATGAFTNLLITLKNSAAATIGTLGITVALGNVAHYVEIDCTPGQRTIIRNTGASAEAMDLLSSGDFLALDPKDADPFTPTWPTLEASITSGALASLTARFRRAYF